MAKKILATAPAWFAQITAGTLNWGTIDAISTR
jgi:hypothetical protein